MCRDHWSGMVGDRKSYYGFAANIVGQTIVADGGTSSLMSLISDFRNPSSAKFGAAYVPGAWSDL
jgi:hypothetical protein